VSVRFISDRHLYRPAHRHSVIPESARVLSCERQAPPSASPSQATPVPSKHNRNLTAPPAKARRIPAHIHQLRPLAPATSGQMRAPPSTSGLAGRDADTQALLRPRPRLCCIRHGRPEHDAAGLIRTPTPPSRVRHLRLVHQQNVRLASSCTSFQQSTPPLLPA